jgi:predicted metalloendopeptidase
MQNILMINQINAEENSKMLREPINRKAWSNILPTDINAYYRAPFNDISIL